MQETRFLRSYQLFGSRGMERLHQARIVVAGLGAVGSYAVEGLARAGVGHLRVVDFDVIRASNINRQIYALESTLGRLKTDVARERVLDINPRCDVHAMTSFIDAASAIRALTPAPDVLIDAIDSLNPKVALLVAAVEAGVPHVLSSMGAASRTDPARIRVDDIMHTRSCPLARCVRKRLKRRGIEGGIRCVYSLEPAAIPDGECALWAPDEDEPVMARGRVRRALGSFSCLTGIFGLTLAREAIMHITTGSTIACAGRANVNGGRALDPGCHGDSDGRSQKQDQEPAHGMHDNDKCMKQ